MINPPLCYDFDTWPDLRMKPVIVSLGSPAKICRSRMLLYTNFRYPMPPVRILCIIYIYWYWFKWRLDEASFETPYSRIIARCRENFELIQFHMKRGQEFPDEALSELATTALFTIQTRCSHKGIPPICMWDEVHSTLFHLNPIIWQKCNLLSITRWLRFVEILC